MIRKKSRFISNSVFQKTGLAPIRAEEFLRSIKRMNEEGRTILLIEQNARKALKIAAHDYVLQKGEIVVKGNPKDLYENDVIKKAYLRG